jgi:GGDEF domain-containing protein
VVVRVHQRLVAPLVIDVREPADAALEPGPTDVGIGASFGLVYLDESSSPKRIDTADNAMFQAKQRGGGVRLAEVT